jgi:hypothetical protein
MSTDEYVKLFLKLIELEVIMSRWKGGRIILMLDAPAEILRKRAQERSTQMVPPIEWFTQVREYFLSLSRRLHNLTLISTSDMDAESVAGYAHRLMGIETAG